MDRQRQQQLSQQQQLQQSSQTSQQFTSSQQRMSRTETRQITQQTGSFLYKIDVFIRLSFF